MKRTMLALAALTIAGAISAARADVIPQTPAQWMLYSAAKVFQYDNRLGRLGVAVVPDVDNEAHIGKQFEINHAIVAEESTEESDAIEPCQFTLRRRDGPIIQTIDFEKLSAEIRVYRSPPGSYVTLQVEGLPGAACEISASGVKTCRAGLSMLLFTPSQEHERVIHALRYIAANGCPAAVLPPW